MSRIFHLLALPAALLVNGGAAAAVTHSALAVSAGYGASCVVTSDGAAHCWGRNDTGQLGDGTTTQRSSPVPVSGLASGVAAISVGGGLAGGHACALTATGSVKCWGTNASWGQVGELSAVTHLAPVEITAVGEPVISLSAGARHTCAVTSDLGAKCWGDDFFGQLGTGLGTTGVPTDVPLANGATGVSAGGSHTCTRASGALKCWGYDFYGQVGAGGAPFNRPFPTDVTGLSSNVTAVAAGGTHSCALTTAGGVKCWGDNFFGQVGDGTNTARGTPVDVSGLATGVVAISAGGNHSCAVMAAGNVKCWGANYRGQLGIGTVDFGSNTPVDVPGLPPMSAVAAGYEHTCAVSAGGGVSCWGANTYGELGNATTTLSAIPVDVTGFVSGSQVIYFAQPRDRILGDGPFAISATASSGLPVTFSSLTTSVCTVAGNVVTPLAAATCTITADQPGDATYSAAPQLTRSLEIRALVADPPPIDLTAIREGDMLHLKWRPEAGFTSYQLQCDGDATLLGGLALPATVAATSAFIHAPLRSYGYRCEVRAIRNSDITAPSRPAFALAYELQELGYVGSLTVGDFDGNGLPELLGTLAGPDGLRPVSEASMGLASLRSPGRAYRDLRLADLDNDGIDDIIANVYSPRSATDSFARLYWGQPNGGYVEDLAFAARGLRGFGETIVVADFTNDGLPDIFIPQYTDLGPDEQNYLLINDGNRNFTERADELGVANRNWFPAQRVEGAQGIDYDGDGWIDLYSGSHLYRNLGGTFTDVRAAVGLPLQFDEGAKFIDWNRDGRMDLVLQTVTPTTEGIIRLFEYDGAQFIERSSVVTNVPVSRNKFGLFAADFNADGTEDLIFPGGFDFAQNNVPPILLLNRGDGFQPSEFLPANYRLTFGSLALGSSIKQNALNDIFLINGSISWLKPLLPQRPFVRIEVLDAQGRRNQHGRVVTMIDPDPRLGRIAKAVDGGSGYMSQSDYPVAFPVPDGVASVQVEVRFKAGTVSATAPVGSTLQVYEDGRAIVRPPATALTAHVTGGGVGTIVSDPRGMRCADSCNAVFDLGTLVTLTPSIDPQSTFTGWSGACTGTGPCIVSMDAAKSVTAGIALKPAPGLTLVSSGTSVLAGQAVTFTVTLAGAPAPTGTVVFRDGGVPIATCAAVPVTALQAVCTLSTLALGSHAVSADYSGDPIYRSMSAPEVTVSVQLASQTITFPALIDRPVGAAPFTLAATASSGLPVVFSSLNPGVCTVSGSMVTLVAGGTCVIAADQPGNGAFSAAARVTQSFGVGISRLVNVSTRMLVGTADNVAIGGFVISGSRPKTVVVNARGPSLTAFQVAGALANPFLQLVSQADSSVLANDDWTSSPDAAAIQALGLAPPHARESSIKARLNPGAYTAVVSGVGGTLGVGIVEVFEVDEPEVPLTNLSARGQVVTGDNVMIGGFIIQGDSRQTVVVRARGPSLAAQQVAGVLSNPVLQLVRRSDGAVFENDDWRTDANASLLQASGFAPSDDRESAIYANLEPGAYTVVVRGAGGATGVAIFEVFAR